MEQSVQTTFPAQPPATRTTKRRGRRNNTNSKVVKISEFVADEMTNQFIPNIIIHLRAKVSDFNDDIDGIGDDCIASIAGQSNPSTIQQYNPNIQAITGYTPDCLFGENYQMVKPDRLDTDTTPHATDGDSMPGMDSSNQCTIQCFWCNAANRECNVSIPTAIPSTGNVCGYGHFCRPECAIAFIYSSNNPSKSISDRQEQYSNIHKIYKEEADSGVKIKMFKPAPSPYNRLIQYGGKTTIDDFHTSVGFAKYNTGVSLAIRKTEEEFDTNDDLEKGKKKYTVKRC
jgi:hypothetical protein